MGSPIGKQSRGRAGSAATVAASGSITGSAATTTATAAYGRAASPTSRSGLPTTDPAGTPLSSGGRAAGRGFRPTAFGASSGPSGVASRRHLLASYCQSSPVGSHATAGTPATEGSARTGACKATGATGPERAGRVPAPTSTAALGTAAARLAFSC